jgi:hypothetical protein
MGGAATSVQNELTVLQNGLEPGGRKIHHWCLSCRTASRNGGPQGVAAYSTVGSAMVSLLACGVALALVCFGLLEP